MERVAREVKRRVNLACDVELLPQREFTEPLMRVNTQPAAFYAKGWDETIAWDEYAESLIN